MNNICIFIPSLKTGGAEKQSLLLASILQESYNLSVVVFDHRSIDKGFDSFINQNNIKLIKLDGFSIFKIIKFYFFLRRNQIDIIFSYLAKCNFIGGIIGRLAGVKYILGGIRSSVLVWHKLLIQRYLHNNLFSYTILNNYAALENLVKKGYIREKFITIPNCIKHVNSYREDTDTNSIRILTVNRFVPDKDYYTALRSIHYLVNNLLPDNIRLHYTIIGYGILHNRILNWINELSLSLYIEIIINPDDLRRYFNMSNIFLNSSLYEGLSNGIMEAMSFSLPVVATNVGDNNKLIIHGKNGYLVDKTDYIGMAEHLSLLIKDPQLRNEFGKYGFNYLSDEYSTEKFKKKYLELITKVTNG